MASKPLFLHRPDHPHPFVLQTDASAVGGAAIVYQEIQDQRCIISYASVRFNKAERKYHINEQECLAVIWAIKRYRPYLEDRPFTLRTDSKALTWLQQFPESRSKLMRWSLLLQQFQYSVEHIPGRENQLPDALSRNPGSDHTTGDPQETERLLPYEYTAPRASSGQQAYLMTEEEPLLHVIQDAQREDPHIQRLVEMAAYIPGPGETQP
ncbi:RNase H-like domain found in reverse transcriptase [Popillia japonica]|uniref:RNase H-like domain found in reverse transcriptase n=1 Tax=Popillia japonica TaxID=7064 RepID=A0AAW1IWK6_POPJA